MTLKPLSRISIIKLIMDIARTQFSHISLGMAKHFGETLFCGADFITDSDGKTRVVGRPQCADENLIIAEAVAWAQAYRRHDPELEVILALNEAARIATIRASYSDGAELPTPQLRRNELGSVITSFI